MPGVIVSIRKLWPECQLVHGRPRHSQSQGSVERLNRQVEQKLRSWCASNESTAWSLACYLVRWQINTALTRATGSVPYKSLTGQKPRCGLSNLPLSKELLATLHTEEALVAVLGGPQGTPLEDVRLPTSSGRSAAQVAGPAPTPPATLRRQQHQ